MWTVAACGLSHVGYNSRLLSITKGSVPLSLRLETYSILTNSFAFRGLKRGKRFKVRHARRVGMAKDVVGWIVVGRVKLA